MYKVCIDPGHGGKNRHNVGPTGYVEADRVLDISLRLKDILEKNNIEVVLTRDDDMTVSLIDRSRIASREKADAFISEHTNAGPPAAGGTTVFYSVDLPGDKIIAQAFSKKISEALGIRNRGAKTRGGLRYPNEDYYAVIDKTQDFGVKHVFLIESAFHSNISEEKLLKNPEIRQKIAEVQAAVIMEYLASGKDYGTNNESEFIKSIQVLCNSLGVRDYENKPLLVDGILGPRTRSAVKKLPVLSL
jgi:N-acetylmuramoyl-L-alanine amidase